MAKLFFYCYGCVENGKLLEAGDQTKSDIQANENHELKQKAALLLGCGLNLVRCLDPHEMSIHGAKDEYGLPPDHP